MKIVKPLVSQFPPTGKLAADISIGKSEAKVANGSEITLIAKRIVKGEVSERAVGAAFKVGSWSGPTKEIPKGLYDLLEPVEIIKAKKEDKKDCTVTLYIRTKTVKK